MEQMKERPIESNSIENVEVVNDNPEQNANEQVTASTRFGHAYKKSLEYLSNRTAKNKVQIIKIRIE